MERDRGRPGGFFGGYQVSSSPTQSRNCSFPPRIAQSESTSAGSISPCGGRVSNTSRSRTGSYTRTTWSYTHRGIARTRPPRHATGTGTLQRFQLDDRLGRVERSRTGSRSPVIPSPEERHLWRFVFESDGSTWIRERLEHVCIDLVESGGSRRDTTDQASWAARPRHGRSLELGGSMRKWKQLGARRGLRLSRMWRLRCRLAGSALCRERPVTTNPSPLGCEVRAIRALHLPDIARLDDHLGPDGMIVPGTSTHASSRNAPRHIHGPHRGDHRIGTQ